MSTNAPLGTLFFDRAKHIGRHAKRHALHKWLSGVGTSISLQRSFPTTGITCPADFLPGDPQHGVDWLKGNYKFVGSVIDQAETHVLDITPPTQYWAENLYGCQWMLDLAAIAAIDNADLQTQAQDYLFDFIKRWHAKKIYKNIIAMQPHIIARRLVSWSRTTSFLYPRLQIEDKNMIMHEASLELSWLERIAHLGHSQFETLQAALGLAIAGFWLVDGLDKRQAAVEMVESLLPHQINEDGGHISRSPSVTAAILADLLVLRNLLERQEQAVPQSIATMIRNTRRFLAMLRHGDGNMAHFQSGPYFGTQALNALLTRETLSEAPAFANISGYQRLTGKKTCIFVDAGAPPAFTNSQSTHISPLAFEMSYQDQQIIVNCGSNILFGRDWELALRGIRAHSTVSFSPKNAKRLTYKGTQPIIRRLDEDNAQKLDMTHDAFAEDYGVEHNRQIYLRNDGMDIRGQDMLLPTRNVDISEPHKFEIHFHLHPNISAHLQGNNNSGLLVMKKGGGWQLRLSSSQNVKLSLAESVYIDQKGHPHRTQQFVATGLLGRRGSDLNWQFLYLDPSKKGRS